MKSAKVESILNFESENGTVVSMIFDQALSADERGVRLCVHLQPNAKQTQLAGRHGEALKLKVQAPPVDGAANKAAAKFLARIFGVSARQVELLHGRTSREKLFLIQGVSLDEAAEILKAHL